MNPRTRPLYSATLIAILTGCAAPRFEGDGVALYPEEGWYRAGGEPRHRDDGFHQAILCLGPIRAGL